MPKLAFCLGIMLSGLLNQAAAQNCALSGTPAWSKQLSNVIAECDNRFISPNGKLLLRIDTQGKIRVFDVASGSEFQIDSSAVEPPAMVSWSPTSSAFFVNDGEGSGMSSTFRFFRIAKGKIVEDKTIEKRAVELYRNQRKCASRSADPNVWGIGWTPGGALFYVLVQATVNSPCGVPGSFISLTIKEANDSVAEQFSEEATKTRFEALLPLEVYFK